MHRIWMTLPVLSAALLGFWLTTAVKNFGKASADRTAQQPDRQPAVAQSLRDLPPANTKALDKAITDVSDAIAKLSKPPEELPTSLAEEDPDASSNWNDYPRTEWSLGSYLCRLDGNISARPLVRNRDLNPVERALPPESVKQLDLLLTTWVGPELLRFNQMQVQMSARDVERLNDKLPWEPTNMVTRKLRLGDGTLQHVPCITLSGGAGPTYVYRGTAEGGFVQVPQTELPSLMQAKQMRVFVIIELGNCIVDWFAAAGLCNGAQAELVRQDVFAWAQKAVR